MHRKDYKAIADAIGKAWAEVPPSPHTDAAIRKLIDALGDVFKVENGAFRRDLFTEACATSFLANRKPYRKKKVDPA